MKYLSDYTEEAQSKLWNECDVFVAFTNDDWDKQAAEKGRPDVKDWISFGGGIFVPKDKMEQFTAGLEEISLKGMEQDLADNGREAILARELMNYEIGYSDINDPNFRSGISGYGFTEEEIEKAYNKIMREVEW